MQFKYSCDEEEGERQGICWSEEGSRSKDNNKSQIRVPWLIQFFIMHIGVHIILFLKKVIDGLEEIIVKLIIFLAIVLEAYLFDLKVYKRDDCIYNGQNEIDNNHRLQLSRYKVIAVLYTE